MTWILVFIIFYGLVSLAVGMTLATLGVKNCWNDMVSLMHSHEAHLKTYPSKHKTASGFLGYLLARSLILYVWLSGSAYFTFQWPFFVYDKLRGRT